MGFRFSCDGSWFSRKLILKFWKTLYILVTLSMFQPNVSCAAVRVQDYCAGGTGSIHAPFLFFFKFSHLFYCLSTILPLFFRTWDRRDSCTSSIHSWGGQTGLTLYDHMLVDERKACTCTVKIIPFKCTLLC